MDPPASQFQGFPGIDAWEVSHDSCKLPLPFLLEFGNKKAIFFVVVENTFKKNIDMVGMQFPLKSR